MLSLNHIVNRTSPPAPWKEGDNIPWDDPEFSKRMLAEHLSQDHDLASRRTERIDAHVAQLLEDLPQPPAGILDLACGPGLYLSRLCAAGYTGVGIDFSPASIEYAKLTRSDVEYRLDDLRTADFGTGFGAVLLLYGQINVFRRAEARSILARARAALAPGGVIVLEPQMYEQVEQAGHVAPAWSSHAAGLFSADAHILLTEAFWDEPSTTATQRFYAIDVATGGVRRHALSTIAYTDTELVGMLKKAGFDEIESRASLTDEQVGDGLYALIASAR